MRRKIVIRALITLLPVVAVAACYWAISRPPDPEKAIAQIYRSNVVIRSAIATHVPYVDPTRVAYSAISMRGDTVEVGLFALDFFGYPMPDGYTTFTGTIANVGDLPASRISVTIWLTDVSGQTVDWVDLSVPDSSLLPNEGMGVSAHYVPGQHAPRLLHESLFFGNNSEPTITLYHEEDVVTRSTLDGLLRFFPSASTQAVWTKPSSEWTGWYVDLSYEHYPHP